MQPATILFGGDKERIPTSAARAGRGEFRGGGYFYGSLGIFWAGLDGCMVRVLVSCEGERG